MHILFLISDSGADFVFTRHIQQDCLEHFFGIIRGKGGHRDNPDAKSFRLDYRQAVVDYLMVVGKNTNCQEDQSHLLLKLQHLFEVNNTYTAFTVIYSPSPISVSFSPHEIEYSIF